MPRQAILIMTDTQPTAFVGCYADAPDFVRTPCLDRFAGSGLRFDRAYTCQPVCGPARAALFTGTYPHTNGSWGNTMPIGDSIRTLGQRVRDAGITAGYIGKWHLDAGDYFGDGICPDGWEADYWYDMRTYLEELTDEERYQSRQEENVGKVPAEFTYAYRCTQRALDFIDKHRDEDFLLVVSYDEPHQPFLCPAEFYEPYRDTVWPQRENAFDDLSDKPPHHHAWASPDHPERARERDIRPQRTEYALACNYFVDHEIGRVLEAAQAATPEALMIYTSDHGDALGAHGLYSKGAAMYEEITRIPMMAAWKGHIAPGQTTDQLVSHIDLAPTLLEALGITPVPFLEGRSLLPALEDPATRVNDAVFVEFARYEIDHDTFGGFQPIRCVIDDRYKLVVNLLSSDELYDLQDDPQELRNLIDSPEHAAIRNRLHDEVIDWMNRTRDPFRGYYWHRRPWRTDAPPARWTYGGYTRQRPDDGYHPAQLDYSTGLPIEAWTRKK